MEKLIQLVCLFAVLNIVAACLTADGFKKRTKPGQTKPKPEKTQESEVGQPKPKATPSETRSTRGVLNDILGVPENRIRDNRGGGEQISDPSELNCNFQNKCCWHRYTPVEVEDIGTEVDWLIVDEDANPALAATYFGTTPTPEGSFAATGAKGADGELKFAILHSCPIECQDGVGVLVMKQWTTLGTVLEVCTLPLSAGDFDQCQRVINRAPVKQEFTIPPQDEPFVIVILASEFDNLPAGVAAIDDIEYVSNGCNNGGGGPWPPEPPAIITTRRTTPRPITAPPATMDEACEAVQCNFEKKSSPTCFFENAGAEPFRLHRHGFERGSETDKYYTRAKGQGEAILTSPPFDAPRDLAVVLDYFVEGDDTILLVCDGQPLLEDSEKCEALGSTSSVNGVYQRHWKQAAVLIAGGTDKQINIVARPVGGAEGAGGRPSSVGIADLWITEADGKRVTC